MVPYLRESQTPRSQVTARGSNDMPRLKDNSRAPHVIALKSRLPIRLSSLLLKRLIDTESLFKSLLQELTKTYLLTSTCHRVTRMNASVHWIGE